MKPYDNNPLTPRMLRGLRELQDGNTLDYHEPGCCVGRPTKQSMAKHGLATFDVPRDWDGPMHITSRGLLVLRGKNDPGEAISPRRIPMSWTRVAGVRALRIGESPFAAQPSPHERDTWIVFNVHTRALVAYTRGRRQDVREKLVRTEREYLEQLTTPGTPGSQSTPTPNEIPSHEPPHPRKADQHRPLDLGRHQPGRLASTRRVRDMANVLARKALSSPAGGRPLDPRAAGLLGRVRWCRACWAAHGGWHASCPSCGGPLSDIPGPGASAPPPGRPLMCSCGRWLEHEGECAP